MGVGGHLHRRLHMAGILRRREDRGEVGVDERVHERVEGAQQPPPLTHLITLRAGHRDGRTRTIGDRGVEGGEVAEEGGDEWAGDLRDGRVNLHAKLEHKLVELGGDIGGVG